MTFILLLIIAVILLWFIVKKTYAVQIDNTLLFTGAPGTGKTNKMVSMALKYFRKSRKRVRRRNTVRRYLNKFRSDPLDLFEEPLLLSNIPIRISRKEMSVMLELEHLLLVKRIPPLSVTVCTELGKIASQYDWQNLNVQDNVNDFISMYRQYTYGGYFFADDQSSDNIAVTIRRRIGTVVNMMHFRKLWKFYWVKVRNMSISEDIKVIEDDFKEESMKWNFGMFPLFHKNYDTYAFSERYKTVPKGEPERWVQFKTNRIMAIPTAVMYRGALKGQKTKKLVNENDD